MWKKDEDILQRVNQRILENDVVVVDSNCAYNATAEQ